MSESIQIDLSSPDVGSDLAGYLCSKGLAASIVPCGDHCELDVIDAVDPRERLQQTFEDALRGWLATNELPLVPIMTSARFYLLRPPAG